MNVLLIGGCSNVINNLIIKLNKEGHRIYLLTGSRYEKQPYQRVFEKYHFPYDAGCLNEIFESINPDLTILWELTIRTSTGTMRSPKRCGIPPV